MSIRSKYFPKDYSKLPNDYTFKYVKGGRKYSKPIKNTEQIIAMKKDAKNPKDFFYYIAEKRGDYTEIKAISPRGVAKLKTRDEFPDKVEKHIICMEWTNKIFASVLDDYGGTAAANASKTFLNECRNKFNLSLL